MSLSLRQEASSECAALDKVMKEIERVSPMCLESSRGDTNMKTLLAKATRGKQYSLLVTGNPDYHNLSYVQAKVVFARAQQQFEFHKGYKNPGTTQLSSGSSTRPNRWAAKETLFAEEDHEDDSDDDAEVHFTGQGRLAPHPKYVQQDRRTIGSTTGPNSRFSNAGRDAGCFNCGSKDHVLRNCKQALNFETIAKNKSAYYEAKKGVSRTNVTEAMIELANDLHEVFIAREVGKPADNAKGETFFTSSENNGNSVLHALVDNSHRHRCHKPSLTDALHPSDSHPEDQHF